MKNIEFFLIGLVAVILVFTFLPILLLLITIQAANPILDKISSFFFRPRTH